MRTVRIRGGDLPVTIAAIEEYLRTPEGYEPAVMLAMAHAATVELEERAGLAMLLQTVTVTTGPEWSADIELPVGPVATGATATVSVLEGEGTLTPVASGCWLETGRWPVLHVTDPTIQGRLVISYTAGLAATAEAVPQDVRHAVCDLVAQMYEGRGEGSSHLSPIAARFVARQARVRL